jgi:hypothetical protein
MRINIQLPDGPDPDVVTRLADQIREETLPVYYKNTKIGMVVDACAVGAKIQLTLNLIDIELPSNPSVRFRVIGTPKNAIAYAAVLQEDIYGKNS